MIRHFTATGIAVVADAVLLVEHVTLGLWLPPGGHAGENEDPAEAMVREVQEESGLVCEIVSDEHFTFKGSGVCSIPRPFAILVETLPDDDGSMHQAARWVRCGDVQAYATPPDVPLLIDAALECLAQRFR